MSKPDQSPIQDAVRDFLRRHAPFDRMEPAHIDFLAQRLTLSYYATGEVIAAPEQGAAQRLLIIKQGRVRGESARDADAWELVAGECFPVGALLAQRPVHALHRAAEDTFCFELPAEEFHKLLALSPVFQDFCTRRLASLLDETLRVMRGRCATEIADNLSFAAPLRNLIRRTPVVCAPDTPLRAALAQMQREHVGSIVAVDAQQRPVGVFTLHDLLAQVANTHLDLEAPLAQVMSRAPLALPPEARAHEAALLMAREGIGHVCVVEQERLVGMLSERDLFSLQRVGLVRLSRRMRQAPDLDTLVALGSEVQRLIEQFFAQGLAAEQVTQIITQLNDDTTRRVIELCLDAVETPLTPFTWLAFGSEGRQEQTVSTDQDNGLLFVTPPGQDTETLRVDLLTFAQRVNTALARCGFPLCAGGIMASNPRWCLSLDEWRATFANWIQRGDAPVLLNATIFFDFRSLYGPEQPVHALRSWLNAEVRANRGFLRRMVENALGNRPPLGLLGDFVLSSTGTGGTLDLKVNAATAFVDAARILGLAAGSDTTNTVMRLRSAAAQWRMDSAEVESWVQAFLFIQMLRLRLQHSQRQKREPLGNRIDPASLNDLDRRILKEALRQARKLQSKLETFFQF